MKSAWIGILALLSVGCASVDISATRNPSVPGPIQPVAFVIYQGNTGAQYTEPLRTFLLQEAKTRTIPARVTILTGAELDEGVALENAAAGMSGVISIVPVGGTSYFGALKQILYDVQAYKIVDKEKGEGVKIWRARVDTNSGAYDVQIRGRLELMAKDLIERLIKDGVLAATG